MFNEIFFKLLNIAMSLIKLLNLLIFEIFMYTM